MNIKICYLYAALMMFGFAGCNIKTRLTKSELKWIDAYHVNDTLIFRSGKGVLDTSVIIKKELFYPEPNNIEVNGTWLPQWAEVWYTNRALSFNPNGAKLVTIIKKKPKKETYMNYDYLYSGFTSVDINSGSLEKYKKDKVYEIELTQNKSKPEDIKLIFIHEDYGIIKYITFSNEVWERINVPQ
ncbi:MAG: hypothetical protein JST81_10885 [Bacteroidetes bacterium]|nr:hypothetical protein [Bacteroidota bacterium]